MSELCIDKHIKQKYNVNIQKNNQKKSDFSEIQRKKEIRQMKIKKRYIVACVLLCIVSILISIGVFHLEMTLSKFSKLNDTLSTSWGNTELFVIKTAKTDEDLGDVKKEFYLGKVTYVTVGKYVAYGREYYYNTPIPYYGELKVGDKVSVYYKPDSPERLAFKAPFTTYIIAIGALLIIDIIFIVVARLLNKSLRENTFSDAPVSFMDIPICILIAGFVICFFMGMFIGNISINDSYTNVNNMIVQDYKDTETQHMFGSNQNNTDSADTEGEAAENSEKTE